jgi:hypothetical protein
MSLTARIEVIHQPSTSTDSYGSMIMYAQVFVAIVDAATGSATNGNNCVVTYTIEENNNVSTGNVTVPGMRSRIYDGEIGRVTFNSSHTVVSSSNKNFNFKTLTGGEESVPPPPQTSDIHINNIFVDSPESASDAHDGQINVDATSNYLPLVYKLNDTLTQASSVFIGLSGGNYTITVVDASGNSVSQNVFVPTINNLLHADPSVSLPGGNISRWSAAFNPVVFTYQRRDFNVTNLQLHTINGKTRVFINKDITDVVIGDMVYMEAGNYIGTYEVTDKYNSNALVIDVAFGGAATGFININRLRPYYKMHTRVTFYDKITGRENTITSTNRPNNKGITRADISNFLQSLLRAKDESDYTQANFRDDNLSASYKIAYAQHWDNGTAEGYTSPYITIDNPFYVLYAAKQLGNRYGGNLAAYVPFSTVPNGADKAKWITDFAEPAYSNSYPFDIGFIYNDDLVGRDLYAEFALLDINRNPLPGGPDTSYLLNDDGSWLLNQDGSKMVIARQSVSVVPVPEQLGLNRLLINNNFANDVYYINVTLKYDDEDNIVHTITETQTIRVDDAVDDQSVYLRWIGLNGSWNYYRFVYNQEVSLDVQNAVIIKNYVSDWEHQDSIEEVISKTAGQKMKVTAEDLSVSDIKGLQSIKFSPKVQMLVNKNPVKWQTIVINTATYSEYETRNGQAPFSVTFNLPAINIQAQ